MRLSDYGRLALRESRRSRGRIALFMGCIAVGVAAVVLVGGLSAGVGEGIRSEGRRLMAADVVVEGRRELPATLDDVVAGFAADAGWPSGSIERADVREFVSVVVAPGGRSSQLAELKAVAGGYPFYGGLRLDPPRPLSELLDDQSVVVAPELLERLGLKIGDSLNVGGAPFRVAAAVLEEPDKLSISFTLGPRVFLSHAGLWDPLESTCRHASLSIL